MSATMRWRTTSALGEVHERRARRCRPSIRSRPDQPAAAAGHVDLGGVAGDDRLGAEADAGEEHLHLLGRGVLRLVEDDEAVVERAAAHEGQRRHLDRLALEQALRALGLDHVVERVVERAQVGVDLGHQVAGQEAEPLAGLDRRAGEDDALDLLGLQRLHGHGHGQPALAGAGRAEAEGDDVLADGVDVALLAARSWAAPCGPRADRRTSCGAAPRIGRSSARTMSIDAAHAGAVERLALLEQHDELLEQPPDLPRRRGRRW